MFRPQRLYFIFLLLALPLLYVLRSSDIQVPVHRVTQTILKPAFILGQGVVESVATTQENIRYFLQAFQSVKHYENRILELETQLVHYEEVLRENERLRDMLEFQKTLPSSSVAASVMGWDMSLFQKTLLINKGSKEKLKVGSVVTVPRGLVGRIVEISSLTARVMLLTDPSFRVNAVTHDSRALGILAGDGTEKLKLRYIDPDAGVKVGEYVVTSGMSEQSPKGILIGVVTDIGRDDDGLHLVARVKPFADFSRIEEVLCLDY